MPHIAGSYDHVRTVFSTEASASFPAEVTITAFATFPFSSTVRLVRPLHSAALASGRRDRRLVRDVVHWIFRILARPR